MTMKWILTNWVQKKKYEKFFDRVESDFFGNDKYQAYLEDRILETLRDSGDIKPKRAAKIILSCIRQALLDKYLTENRYIRFLIDNKAEFFVNNAEGNDVVEGYERIINNFIHNKQQECSDYILSHLPKYYRKFADNIDVHTDYPATKHGEKDMLDDIIMLLSHHESRH
ncbi:hypothetical protein [Enterovibrio calviensis]|uniref:hypothetical protein n=1 Tax=Enterovibrio calviensis TaxID=91359 RepID=UPI00048675B2|nr:hypothetical protein [Enterovibrio calviensis]